MANYSIYFSPTGGTKKAGQLFCNAVAQDTVLADLAQADELCCTTEVAVFAVPVFAGRIPHIAAERIKSIDGRGKKAVTIAVYGNRAYDDALLELNNAAEQAGFKVVASAALVAQHSMVKEVAAGRPDTEDAAEIAAFAQKAAAKIAADSTQAVAVPGNFPHRDGMTVSSTPLCTDSCTKCGRCAQVCPTKAITATKADVTTQLEKCILCLACTAHCPTKARILPPAMQQGLNQKLGALKDVRNANEFFV